MKYVLMVLIIFIFGYIGYKKKHNITNQKNIIDDIKDYIVFYDSNISVFKTNLVEINSRYIIQQNNKNAQTIKKIGVCFFE